MDGDRSGRSLRCHRQPRCMTIEKNDRQAPAFIDGFKTGTGRTMIMKRLLLSGAVATSNNDLPTLDPAIGYDWQNWSVIKSIFDGLMDYEPGSTKLTPDLAES